MTFREATLAWQPDLIGGPDFAERVGLTYRQLNRMCSLGIIPPSAYHATRGSGSWRGFPDSLIGPITCYARLQHAFADGRGTVAPPPAWVTMLIEWFNQRDDPWPVQLDIGDGITILITEP